MSSIHQTLATLLVLNLAYAESYRILALVPAGSRSHKNVFTPLVEGLAAKGHQVTFMSPYDSGNKVPNVKEVILEDNAKLMEESQKSIFETVVAGNPLLNLSNSLLLMTRSCENFLDHPFTEELLKNGKKYDLAIVLAFINDCALVVGSLVAENVVTISPAGIVNPFGSPAAGPPSVIHNPMAGLPSKMDFLQRLKNTAVSLFVPLVFENYFLPPIQAILTKRLPQAPSVYEATNQISFFLYNADPVMTPPRPGAKNLVGVGAMHCKQAKPLPQELEDFIQSSGEEGFVYFSLGSIAPSKFLPADKKEAFISALSRLKQKVIWKFEEDLPNAPANVKTVRWAPQQNILGHPKIRAFMTHGGLLSLQETIYHGVPVVVIPLFGDQPGNAARVKELEIGEPIQFDNLTADNIYNTLNHLITTKSYASNMKKYSAVLKDQPQKPLNVGIFWIEYVIRHKGASHLRSLSQDMCFFQYYLLDVIFLLVGVAFSTLILAYCLLKRLFKRNPDVHKKNQ